MDPIEAEAAASYALQASNPVYVRLAKSGEPRLQPPGELDLTQPRIVRDGQHVGLVFHGSVAPEAFEAAERLSEEGVHPRLISVTRLQPFPKEQLFPLLKDLEQVFTLEEHFLSCGLGARLGQAVAEQRPAWTLHCLGIADQFLHEIQKQPSIRAAYGINAQSIVQQLRKTRQRSEG